MSRENDYISIKPLGAMQDKDVPMSRVPGLVSSLDNLSSQSNNDLNEITKLQNAVKWLWGLLALLTFAWATTTLLYGLVLMQ